MESHSLAFIGASWAVVKLGAGGRQRGALCSFDLPLAFCMAVDPSVLTSLCWSVFAEHLEGQAVCTCVHVCEYVCACYVCVCACMCIWGGTSWEEGDGGVRQDPREGLNIFEHLWCARLCWSIHPH